MLKGEECLQQTDRQIPELIPGAAQGELREADALNPELSRPLEGDYQQSEMPALLDNNLPALQMLQKGK
ncbi:hypothetical protein Y1Q_0009387 [Alligator mississippiensis]|uniref:Uncharacterized protein n=1 Tax=Alligator mississippiensis TaxID=8496 RepID=A0A151N7K5_ALLMI|nr:hypothetical protein Y1Q_0009387 [Alligator mississippiensis]